MLKSPRIRVRSGLLREDLAGKMGNFEDSTSAESSEISHFTSRRKVVLRTLSNDVVMCSQGTEPDCDMVSVASSRLSSSTPTRRTRMPTDTTEIGECSRSSLKAWALACRNEADAAVIFAEVEERRAQSAAALAAAALIKANKLAFAAEEARRKAAATCKRAKEAKFSAQKAADFAVKSLEAASKAEELAIKFRSLRI